MNISKGELLERVVKKISAHFEVNAKKATAQQVYYAVVMVVRGILEEKYDSFSKKIAAQEKKQVYYLCMEYLIGRSLKNNLFNLGLEKTAREALQALGQSLEEICELEPDAALGNGGLGRLAACFMDGLATNNFPEIGYSLRYDFGMFRQKMIDGWQTELPDVWLPKGGAWLRSQPEKALAVQFGGQVEQMQENGQTKVRVCGATTVYAVPCDMLLPGFNSVGVGRLRLWSAHSQEFDVGLFNSGEYFRAMEQNAMAEALTKLLYPEDAHPKGKDLRLSQQYFLVSASVQDILRRHLKNFSSLDSLPEKAAIHLNDTHPVLAIPELMRLLIDEHGYELGRAFEIVKRCTSYTNHTVMPEALECWDEELLRRRLPRIFQIITEINQRFCGHLRTHDVKNYHIEKMAILLNGKVRMANLAAACSHTVNGVSGLHTEILKSTIFSDFYLIKPDKFVNITNGIAQRRWLNQSNPRLAALCDDLIGLGYRKDPNQLARLRDFACDASALGALREIKQQNKADMAAHILRTNGIVVDVQSVFDVQIKRLHEYKRQLLNALHIFATYLRLKNCPDANFLPKTYIFSAKAAPGYFFAKKIIKFIIKLSELINADPTVREQLRVVFLENYNVTLAQRLIPAAEISEQISLAGTEASGTGNMKLMLNGAVTIGTLDGANIEILEAVGEENIKIFGMDAQDVASLRASGYTPSVFYIKKPELAVTIDAICPLLGEEFADIVHSLKSSDPYMVLADFESFAAAQQNLSEIYRDVSRWNAMSLANIAGAGRFSADYTVQEYAEKVWGISPVK